MRTITVISGKGGTGKTTITASLAYLSGTCVAVDCDVDAPNYHLLGKSNIINKGAVVLGKIPVIDQSICTQCGLCVSTCRYQGLTPGPPVTVEPLFCEGCGVCKEVCPTGAITMEDDAEQIVMTSMTPSGVLIHSQLPPGGENSGRLVSILRSMAKAYAEEHNQELILCDGPPGIGCPVIASITGADDVLIVTEPGVSALHDVQRAAALAKHFHITPMVCINRWDVSPRYTREIMSYIESEQMIYAGSVRFDPGLEQAQWERCAPAALHTPAAEDIRKVGMNILHRRSTM